MFRSILQALGSVQPGVLLSGAQRSSLVLADPEEEGRGRQRKAASPPATHCRFPPPAWGDEPRALLKSLASVFAPRRAKRSHFHPSKVC